MISFKLTESASLFKSQLCDMEKLGLVSLSDNGVPLYIKQGSVLTLSLSDTKACVEYGSVAEIFRGVFSLSRGVTGTFNKSFELCGEMIDNSRNSVMTVQQTKKHIVYSAAFGLNCLYLYNEDTFEVEGEPYFGYMRGRYTTADLKEICTYADMFGIEIIPCIQTLAHLNQALRWYRFAPIRDIDDILLADEDATYDLIEKFVATWRAVTLSKNINIGMDEAHHLGRGKYLDKHGLVPRFELMCRHLERVISICEKYGFKPMMWSDMFFRLVFGGYYTDGAIDQSLMEKVPKNVTLIYWDYYSTERSKYVSQLEKHAKFDNELAFAGGAWKWSGFTPSINHSLSVSQMALEEVRARRVKYCFVTCWGDDGAECLSGCVLPVLALYGAHNYLPADKAEKFASDDVLHATGYTTEEFCALCSPSVTPSENHTPYANPTKYLLYNDPLKGLFDRHTTDAFPAFYKDCAEKLGALALRGGSFSYLFDVQARLCHVLELKSTLGVELKAAYDSGNKEKLAFVANELIPEIISRINDFYKAFRAAWLSESRPGGFDVQDLRLGGLVQRLRSAQAFITDYLNGNTDRIEELEEARLFFDCRPEDSDRCLTIGMNHYHVTPTPNIY